MTDCATLKCPALAYGSTRCHCGKCHRTLTGVTAFDRHQLLADGNLVCLDPETSRDSAGRLRFAAWQLTPEGHPVWGRALRPGESLDGRSGRGGGPQTA